MKNFIDCSDREKRNRIENITLNYSLSEIVSAAEKTLRAQRVPQIADCLKVYRKSENNPNLLSENLKKCMLKNFPDMSVIKKFTPSFALALLLSGNFTQRIYKRLRKELKENFPVYEEILVEKNLAMPENILITEVKCEVDLQSLLNHTLIRILEFISLDQSDSNNFTLLVKYGSDGSSGHSMYKQIFQNAGQSDSSIFITAIVPLELKCNDTQKIVWENERTSSYLFTRPVKLQLIRENTDVIIAEHNYMKDRINQLENFHYKNKTFNYNLFFTMIDGKVNNFFNFFFLP